ncbi:MAG: PadR family transcriptional regulator [Candidatus Bilamarchaeaceae archaeon]
MAQKGMDQDNGFMMPDGGAGLKQIIKATLRREQIMKRTSVFLIWLIKRNKEMCGYDIVKAMRDGSLTWMTASRIYPVLNSMRKNGLVEQKVVKVGRRTKKIYTVTKKGDAVLAGVKRTFAKGGLIRDFIHDVVE